VAARPFISYAREDRNVAVLIHAELTAVGAEPWLDAVNLIAGEDWELAVERALRTATHVIVLISERSVNKRGYVQKELRQALSLLEEYPPGAVFIIPVRLDDLQPQHPMLQRLQWVDLFIDYGAGFRQLIAAMGIAPPVEAKADSMALVRGYPNVPRDVIAIIVSRAQRVGGNLSRRGDYVQREIGAWRALSEFRDPELPRVVQDLIMTNLAKAYPNHFAERQRMLLREAQSWKLLQGIQGLFSKREMYERARAAAEEKWPDSFAGQYYCMVGDLRDFQDGW
jgi:hypothetical protein